VETPADAWPEEIQLKKGKHTVVMQLRAENPSTLKPFVNLPIAVDADLGKKVSVGIFNNSTAALTGGAKCPAATRVAMGEQMPLWLQVSDSAVSELKKTVKPGDTLLGSLAFESTAPTEPCVQGKANGARYCVRYTMPPTAPASPSADDDDDDDDDDTRTDAEKNADELRDLKLRQLTKLRGADSQSEHEALLGELMAAHAGHFPLLEEAAARKGVASVAPCNLSI
jgi:hypothetical protein